MRADTARVRTTDKSPSRIHEKGPIGRPIGPGQSADATRGSRRASRGAYCTATETSSRTNEVASDESSVPENFRVIVLPMKLFRLIVRRT